MGLLLRGRRGEERKGIEGEWTEGREEEAERVMSGLFPEFSLSTTHASAPALAMGVCLTTTFLSSAAPGG